jgi:hypothetical protein
MASDQDGAQFSSHLPFVGAVAAALAGKLKARSSDIRMRSRNFISG